MNPLDGLRRLPLELEPPRGVRERTRQRLLASFAVPLPPQPVSDVAPRPAKSALVAQHAGVKLAFLALGSGIVGASLAVGAPHLANRLVGTTEQHAAIHVAAVTTPALVPTTVSPAAEAVQVQGLPLVESAPLLQPNSTRRSGKAASSLAAERVLLDAARAQLSSGRALRAFELTDTHLERFAAGKLTEEREALAIAALIKLGERVRASRRAERFKQSYPSSFLTKAIEASLGDSP